MSRNFFVWSDIKMILVNCTPLEDHFRWEMRTCASMNGTSTAKSPEQPQITGFEKIFDYSFRTFWSKKAIHGLGCRKKWYRWSLSFAPVLRLRGQQGICVAFLTTWTHALVIYDKINLLKKIVPFSCSLDTTWKFSSTTVWVDYILLEPWIFCQWANPYWDMLLAFEHVLELDGVLSCPFVLYVSAVLGLFWKYSTDFCDGRFGA